MNIETGKPGEVLFFKGKLLLSRRGLGMCFWIAMASTCTFCFNQIDLCPPSLLIFGYGLSVARIIFTYARHFNYFSVSEKQLIVYNSIYFWQQTEILLADIKSVRIDMDAYKNSRRMPPYYLRLFLDQLKTRKFNASTLNRKVWIALATELEQHNIRVVNTYPPEIFFRDML